jgi:[protein-PII] uridylyltransferase
MAMRAPSGCVSTARRRTPCEVIIENHLLMASVSQRRDLDDASVIRNFAREMETPKRSNLLTLLTFADSQGTSDKLWNGFKDALLWQLHSPRDDLLTGGTEFIRAEAEQREALLQEVRELAGKSLSAEEINTHFATLPPRYFQVRTAREIIDDLELVHRFMRRLVLEDDRVLSPVIAWRDEADRGYNAVKICTWDRAGLFSKIAGSLSAAGLNILGAQIFTRTDSIVLDTFFVNDGRTGHLATRQQHDQFAELLEKVLTDEDIDLPALIKRQITQQPVYQPYTGEHMATQIHILTTRCPRRARSSKLKPKTIWACCT